MTHTPHSFAKGWDQSGSISRRGFLVVAGAGSAVLAGVGAGTAHAAQTRVAGTPAELEAAIAAARPGETIMMKNGTWRDIKVAFRAVGAPGRPITLRAEVPGKVVISGESYLQLVGDHLVVDGLTFRDGAAPPYMQHVIGFGDPFDDVPGTTFSNHCRVTNVVVDGFNKELGPAPEGTDIWVNMWGQHNRVDHCAFMGKTSNSKVIVGRGFDERASYFQIDNNYFGQVRD